MKPVILASSSPRRSEILKMIRIPFTVQPSDVDESILPGETSEQSVIRLSKMKAESVAGNSSGCIVIGSDTLVEAELDCSRKTILGKPADEDDAFRMLKILSGQRCLVYSGITIIDSDTGHTESAYETTEIHMKILSDNLIRNYIQTKEPLDKAGAFAIQGLGAVFIEKINGDFYNGVGLSASLLYEMLRNFKISLLE